MSDPAGDSLWWHVETENLSAVTTEPVQQCPRGDVPQTHGEVDTTGHQMGHIVPGGRVVGVQETVDPARVAPQHLVGGPRTIFVILPAQEVEHDRLGGGQADDCTVVTSDHQSTRGGEEHMTRQSRRFL